jgi:hypothetical protein
MTNLRTTISAQVLVLLRDALGQEITPVLEERIRERLISPLLDTLGLSATSEPVNTRSLIKARLRAKYPGVDATALEEIVGGMHDVLMTPLRTEIRAAASRRRLDDASLLSSDDLEEARDVFLVDPAGGGVARGFMRVLFRTPRTEVFTPAVVITVPGVGGPRRYRVERAVEVTAEQMETNRDSGLFFVDLPVVALEVGARFNLSPEEVTGASGVPDAVRIVAAGPIQGGVDADTPGRLLDRIRTATRLRSLSTFGGVEYALPTLGAARFYVAGPGDPLMTRDRVFGPSFIGGIPGGYGGFGPSQNLEADFVHIGHAVDVWIPSTEGLRSVSLQGTLNQGVKGIPVQASVEGDGPFVLRTAFRSVGFASRLRSADQRRRFVRRRAVEPVVPGDMVTFDAALSPSTTVFALKEVVGIEGQNGIVLDELPAPLPNPGRQWFRVYSTPATDLGLPYGFAVPLPDRVVRDARGDVLRVGGKLPVPSSGPRGPALPQGIPVAGVRNYIDAVDAVPITRVDRVELSSPVTGTAYAYPATPLFAEFRGSSPNGSSSRDTPVLVRVHLLGPQDVACEGLAANAPIPTDDEGLETLDPVISFAGGTGRDYTPLQWGMLQAVPWFAPSSTTLDTDVLTLSDPNDPGRPFGEFAALRDFAGNLVLVDGAPRSLRPGDYLEVVGEGPSLPPVSIVEILSDRRVRISRSDVPVDAPAFTVMARQGTSRDTLLAEGRGVEGTYSFDVACARLDRTLPESTGHPPAGTPVLETMGPWSRINQGFTIISAADGVEYSTADTTSLVFHSPLVAGAIPVAASTVTLHVPDTETLSRVQSALSSSEIRPVAADVLARMYPPAYVAGQFFFEARDLTAEEAAAAIRRELRRSEADQRIELSDLTDALARAGATYITSGRMFVLQLHPDRTWSWSASRGAIGTQTLTSILPWSITCVRLRARRAGEMLDDLDPANQLETFTLRHGAFNAD